jgi:hypothetical protein
VFQDVLSDESSFEVTDEGEALYKVFLEYYSLLQQKLHGNGDVSKVLQYEDHIRRNGIDTVKLIDHGQCSPRERGSKGRNSKDKDNQRSSHPSGPKKACRQVETNIHHPDAGLVRFPVTAAAHSDLISTGDIVTSSGLGRGSHSTMGRSATQQESLLPEVAKPSKCSTSKKGGKRKASSQKPPVITPSDASEDDRDPSKTRVVTAANRPKRIAPNPASQPHQLLEVRDQVDNINKQHRDVTSISQLQSPLTSFRTDGFVSHSNIKGGRGAGFPLSGRMHDGEMFLNVSTQPTRASSNSKRLRKTKLLRDLQTPANKRIRQAPMATLDGEPGEGSDSTHHLRAKFLEELTIPGPLVFGPPLTQENSHVKSKARKKRTRFEFETTFAGSDENASADSREPLGPDIRLLRPLPQKVCGTRLVPVADKDRAVRGVPCGTPSLEHADQLLRDVASNELAILRGGAGPDVPDWTQDKEYDAVYEGLGGDDQDDANDVQVTTGTSATRKPPVPAAPPMWAQVSCFIASQYIAADH